MVVWQIKQYLLILFSFPEADNDVFRAAFKSAALYKNTIPNNSFSSVEVLAMC